MTIDLLDVFLRRRREATVVQAVSWLRTLAAIRALPETS